MAALTRRRFIEAAGTAALAGALGFPAITRAQGKARIVVIGGGAGGASAAAGLKRAEPGFDVTLIEARPAYPTPFHSNLYLGGLKSFASLVQGYDGLSALGVRVVISVATGIDTAKKLVEVSTGEPVPYDRLVLSPGISFKYGAIEGYSADAAEQMPHAWIAGPQTQALKARLAAMRNGGTVVMAVPALPYRCPPAPYERACMIAHYLSLHKPKSKLILLDAKRFYVEQAAFEEAFNGPYKDVVEIALTDEIDDNRVARVDAATGEVVTVSGRKVVADVANIIPPQTAGEIAALAGAADGDWCPVNVDSFKSTRVNDVYVLGDAASAPDMPKSAASAVSQAGTVVADILADISGKPRAAPSLDSLCWSVLGPDDGIRIQAAYKPGDRDGKRVLLAGPIVASAPGEPADVRKRSYADNLAWYDALTRVTWPPAPEGSPQAAPAATPAVERPPEDATTPADGPPQPRRRRRRRRRVQ